VLNNTVLIWPPLFLLLVSTFIVVASKSHTPIKNPVLSFIIRRHLVFGLLFILSHSIYTIGLEGSVMLLLVSWVIGLAFEYVGVTFGWIFGRYYYTDTSRAFFQKVPRDKPYAWAFIIYICYSVSTYLVEMFNLHANLARILVVPTYAGLLCMSLDLLIDPVATDPSVRAWVWLRRGRYFGIPLTNFIGWFFTGYLTASLFTAYSLLCEGSLVKTELWPYSIIAYISFFCVCLSDAIVLRKYKVITISVAVTFTLLSPITICTFIR